MKVYDGGKIGPTQVLSEFGFQYISRLPLERGDKVSLEGRTDEGVLSRATGCLLGQLGGDSLGSLVEFQGPREILRAYPKGVNRTCPRSDWEGNAGTHAKATAEDAEGRGGEGMKKRLRQRRQEGLVQHQEQTRTQKAHWGRSKPHSWLVLDSNDLERS